MDRSALGWRVPAAHSVYDPAARPRARDPMGHRNDDTIEDTRARKYTKIPTKPNPPEDQKNAADWRSLQRKSVKPASRLLATRGFELTGTTMPRMLLCRIESCDRLRRFGKCRSAVSVCPLSSRSLLYHSIDYKRET